MSLLLSTYAFTDVTALIVSLTKFQDQEVREDSSDFYQ